MQRALLQFRRKENYKLVYEALKLAHREDLIGYGRKCLIKPPANLSKKQFEKRQLKKKIKKAGKSRRKSSR